MHIVACIKRVPLTETQAKVGPDGKSLDTTGVEFMTSFYDDIAVEEAVKTKEKLGGELTILTLGSASSSKEMREAIAKGADRGVVMVDEDWASRDARATAKALADKIKELGADVVFTGRIATDRDNASVGPMLATYLDWACVTDVVELELAEGSGTAKRESEKGLETYSFSLPAVLSCQKDLNEPRRPALKGIMAAKKKPLDEAPAPAIESQASVVQLELPPTRPEGRIVGEGPDAVDALMDALKNEAKVL